MKVHNYKCIVVDDEPLARKVIEDYVSELDGLTVTSSFRNALEAKKYLENNIVDIVFLDINMPKLSGIDWLKNFEVNALVIFTTAYPEFAVEAFEFSGFDYLVKPIAFQRFLKSVDKAKLKLEQSSIGDSFLIVKENKRLYKLRQEEVLYIEAYGDYIKVITLDKKYIVKEKLGAVASRLDSRFLQCHRSFYININRVEYVEGNHAMIAGDQISISASFKDSVLGAYKTRT